MTARALADRDPDLRDLRVLVVGLGRSGLAAATLARAHGARVAIVDRRTEAEMKDPAVEARRAGIEVIGGGHPPRLAADRDLIVLSPGVPVDIPLARAARDSGVPVWGEVELAARFCRGRVVGITGSNGKSTVTAMIGKILRDAGIPGGTGGNLATPFCELLDDDRESAVHAVELSSFQLETVQVLRPAVAMIVNLSPDHLDRHDSYDSYARAKARLLELQFPDDHAVLNADDVESRRFRAHVRGKLHEFSLLERPASGAYLDGDSLVLNIDGRREVLLSRDDLSVPGEHNVANALAAGLAGRLVGCAIGDIARGLSDYSALPHRLEQVRSVREVAFYNDSKATNPAAALCALRAFPAGKIHLILGGVSKGADWTELVDEIAKRARRVLLVGQAADELRPLLVDVVESVDCGTIPRAAEAGLDGAEPGDVVLLAPACASFDQYRNFEKRGDDFRQSVEALASKETGDA